MTFDPSRGVRRWGHEPQRDVLDFHRLFELTVGETPAIRDAEFRLDLIDEECREFREAVEAGDLPEAIKEAMELLYVIYGTLNAFGVDAAPFWALVHESNMAKLGGETREDGKPLKPPGWLPPDIEGLLDRLHPGWDARPHSRRDDHGIGEV